MASTSSPIEALDHLQSVDPVLAGLIDRSPDPGALVTFVDPGYHPELPPYAALVRAIVGQQLSVTVARAIWNRLLDHFGGEPPSPAALLATDLEELRSAAGLSRAKAASLHSLAEHVSDGRLELDRLDDLDDETIESELIAVKGIGPWTAHMFLMTQLGRPDILAPGDLGIKRGVQLAYGLDELPSPADVIERAEPWRPWRSVACRLLWASLEFEPV